MRTSLAETISMRGARSAPYTYWCRDLWLESARGASAASPIK
jgi:hypothetical protein